MQNANLSFTELVNNRRAVRKYLDTPDFDPQIIKNALELATLSPNSSNMQLWQFHRVTTSETKAQLAKYCFNMGAAKTASELVVFVATPNKWEERAELHAKKIRTLHSDPTTSRAKKHFHYYEKLIPSLYNNDKFGLRGLVRKAISLIKGRRGLTKTEVLKSDILATMHKNNALAAMTFMYALTEQGYSSCPLECFDTPKIRKLLELDPTDEITMIVSCGIAAPKGVYGPRDRIAIDKVIKTH